MADLPSPGPAHEFDLTRRKRREIVVQHETFKRFAKDIIDFLLVHFSAKCGSHESLGLAPGKKRRAVSPGQNPDFAIDRPDFLIRAAVNTVVFDEDHRSHIFFLDILDNRLYQFLLFRKLLFEFLGHVLYQRVELGLAIMLIDGAIGLLNRVGSHVGNGFEQFGIDFRRHERQFRFAG